MIGIKPIIFGFGTSFGTSFGTRILLAEIHFISEKTDFSRFRILSIKLTKIYFLKKGDLEVMKIEDLEILKKLLIIKILKSNIDIIYRYYIYFKRNYYEIIKSRIKQREIIINREFQKINKLKC